MRRQVATVSDRPHAVGLWVDGHSQLGDKLQTRRRAIAADGVSCNRTAGMRAGISFMRISAIVECSDQNNAPARGDDCPSLGGSENFATDEGCGVRTAGFRTG